MRTQRRTEESGAALVEFALVVIPLLLLLIGMITYGLILGLQQSVVHTASAAARAAIVTPADQIETRIDQVAGQQLSWLGSRGTHVSTTSTVGPCAASGRECVTVTVTYPYKDQPIIPGFLGLPVPDRITSTATLELEG
ncbi:hypothetical protein FTX61_06375 [Nitriliruptoraceae bacterium ZYF776]|nr:hypothetical protein [Profundirhabdus halotolerans]